MRILDSRSRQLAVHAKKATESKPRCSFFRKIGGKGFYVVFLRFLRTMMAETTIMMIAAVNAIIHRGNS